MIVFLKHRSDVAIASEPC